MPATRQLSRLRSAVRVLEHDPDLASGLDRERRLLAIERLRALVLEIGPGDWGTPSWPDAVRRGPGLLLLDGYVARQVELAGRVGSELLGPGDVLRPWQRDDTLGAPPRRATWRLLERAHVAVLDVEFGRRLAPFPEVHAEIVERALRRARRLGVSLAVVHQPRVEVRVQMALWQLADRFGTVRPDGVLVAIRLTHVLLAEIVAARRPTVSAAVSSLERAGSLSRAPGGGWLLRGRPPAFS
ncbi:MAG TPA: helix-turn-helix domain-containing protein [Solirubrobacteraceae bacterium]|nr:helix-turn-helix domain-containing protein [Solirubrobacteraceae bacterium]